MRGSSLSIILAVSEKHPFDKPFGKLYSWCYDDLILRPIWRRLLV